MVWIFGSLFWVIMTMQEQLLNLGDRYHRDVHSQRCVSLVPLLVVVQFGGQVC